MMAIAGIRQAPTAPKTTAAPGDLGSDAKRGAEEIKEKSRI
jgi:hypothetical protein